MASLTIDGDLILDSILPAMAYYLDSKDLVVYKINIKNSVYEIGNFAHDYLVRSYFNQVTFIDTAIKKRGEK